MEDFQADNIDAIRSERIVCIVKAGELRVKAFQVVFDKDGSLFITFPYFTHHVGILSSSSIPATGTAQSQVNLEIGGKVASHLVKYSHHTDGRAQFSQTGKIKTEIKRQSIALDKQHGHIFSLIVQGLEALDPTHAVKDSMTNAKRAVVEFTVEHSDAVKFVGQWFDVNTLCFNRPTPTFGPILPMKTRDGDERNAIMVASPFANTRHVLAITCEETPKLNEEREAFVFYGGFDAPETMTDPAREAGFLAFIYPILDPGELSGRIGSVDYIPKS